jgi:hypothetical protein
MDKQGYAEVILRFGRTVLLIDAVLAGVAALIIFLLGWRTPEAYRFALNRTGVILLLFGCLIGIGGFSARTSDVGAYTISGAGNMSENLMHIAEARHSSLGCFFLLLVAGLGLMALGDLLPVVTTLIGSILNSPR